VLALIPTPVRAAVGDEEARIVTPGIAAAGPASPPASIDASVTDLWFTTPPSAKASTLFVALYHDQGLIPVKLVDFDLSVNVRSASEIRPRRITELPMILQSAGIVKKDSFAAASVWLNEMSKMVR